MAQLQLKSQAERGRWKPFTTISWGKKSSLGSQKRKLKAVYINLRKQTDLFLFRLVFFFFPLAPINLIFQLGDRKSFYSTNSLSPLPW